MHNLGGRVLFVGACYVWEPSKHPCCCRRKVSLSVSVGCALLCALAWALLRIWSVCCLLIAAMPAPPRAAVRRAGEARYR